MRLVAAKPAGFSPERHAYYIHGRPVVVRKQKRRLQLGSLTLSCMAFRVHNLMGYWVYLLAGVISWFPEAYPKLQQELIACCSSV
jgi:hypothetical protein